jgi:hypothetical protein
MAADNDNDAKAQVGPSFRERLPPSCPPSGAHTNGFEVAYRFIPGQKPTSQDFDSYHAQGKACPPGADLCRWASCSLFVSKGHAAGVIKLPKVRARFTHFAVLRIAPDSGYSLANGGHIDFWMFKNFDPVSAVVTIEEIEHD